jgi:hypothetical protein
MLAEASYFRDYPVRSVRLKTTNAAPSESYQRRAVREVLENDVMTWEVNSTIDQTCFESNLNLEGTAAGRVGSTGGSTLPRGAVEGRLPGEASVSGDYA